MPSDHNTTRIFEGPREKNFQKKKNWRERTHWTPYHRPLQLLCHPAAHCAAVTHCRCCHPSQSHRCRPSWAAKHLVLHPIVLLLHWRQSSGTYCAIYQAAAVPLPIMIALSSRHPLRHHCPSPLPPSIMIT